MLPFPEHPQNILDKSFAEQLDLNPHLLLNSSSYFVPSTPAILGPEGFCDILFPSDGITNAVPSPTRPCLPLSDDSAPPLMERRNIDDNTSSIRKRSTRKDRHSKIFTANGPRDRRMRLSIDVAQKFFQLQDMLGFDKASKTVQWLLTMSKAAIKELATTSSFKICTSGNQSPKSESSTLMCEDSSTLPVSKNRSSAAVTAVASCEVKKAKANKGAIKPSRKTEFHSALARESRARARERARERTREKQRMTSLSSSIPSDAIKEESNLHNLSSLLEFADEEEGKPCAPNQCLDIASERAYEYPMIGGSVLIPIFDKNQIATAITDTGSIFQEQWDMEAISFYSR